MLLQRFTSWSIGLCLFLATAATALAENPRDGTATSVTEAIYRPADGATPVRQVQYGYYTGYGGYGTCGCGSGYYSPGGYVGYYRGYYGPAYPYYGTAWGPAYGYGYTYGYPSYGSAYYGYPTVGVTVW